MALREIGMLMCSLRIPDGPMGNSTDPSQIRKYPWCLEYL